jgi:hypothetical protein
MWAVALLRLYGYFGGACAVNRAMTRVHPGALSDALTMPQQATPYGEHNKKLPSAHSRLGAM